MVLGTTFIGKLVSSPNKLAKKVMLAAADTFRAGAVARLVEWGPSWMFLLWRVGPEKLIQQVWYLMDGTCCSRRELISLYDWYSRPSAKQGTTLWALLEKIVALSNVVPEALANFHRCFNWTERLYGTSYEFSKITPLTGIVLTKIGFERPWWCCSGSLRRTQHSCKIDWFRWKLMISGNLTQKTLWRASRRIDLIQNKYPVQVILQDIYFFFLHLTFLPLLTIGRYLVASPKPHTFQVGSASFVAPCPVIYNRRVELRFQPRAFFDTVNQFPMKHLPHPSG